MRTNCQNINSAILLDFAMSQLDLNDKNNDVIISQIDKSLKQNLNSDNKDGLLLKHEGQMTNILKFDIFNVSLNKAVESFVSRLLSDERSFESDRNNVQKISIKLHSKYFYELIKKRENLFNQSLEQQSQENEQLEDTN